MAGEHIFVLAAQVAANLHFATKIAEQLTLTAKNAHAISARAGQQSAGFRAITSYIEELAANTIRQAAAINRDAVVIAMLASERERSTRALEYFLRAAEIAPDATFLSSMNTPRETTRTRLRQIEEEFALRLRQLRLQLLDTRQQLRAASIIASTSKIEAALAGSFQPQLDVIAHNIARSAEEIEHYLQVAQQRLNLAIDNLATDNLEQGPREL